MRYLGGKSKNGLAREIVALIEARRPPGWIFVDVFCGALNVVRHARPPRAAMDINPALIRTLRAATFEGWIPPNPIPRATYEHLKAYPDPTNPLTAFTLFGCSIGGRWAGGYASEILSTGRARDFAQEASRGLLRKTTGLQDCPIVCLDYQDLPLAPGPGVVLYCDPPYLGTHPYEGAPPFNHAAFWQRAEQWARSGALVFVSEKAAPSPWAPVMTWAKKQHMSKALPSGDKPLMIEALWGFKQT